MDQYARAFLRLGDERSLDDTDANGPPVVEVVISWGDQVLDVQHLRAPYSFVLETDQKCTTANTLGRFLLPDQTLKRRRVTLVKQIDFAPVVVLDELPPECEVYGTTWGPMTVRELAARARSLRSVYEGAAVWPLRHCGDRRDDRRGDRRSDPHGLQHADLHDHQDITLRLGAFQLVIGVTKAAEPVPRALFTQDGHELTYFALSFLSAAGVVASATFFAPPLGLTAAEGLNRDDLVLMQQYLDAAAEREQERKLETGASDEQAAGGEPGRRARDDEGAMGYTRASKLNRRYQIQGPPDNPDPHLARTAMLREATMFGTVGILNSMLAGPNAPTALWGREEALGVDAQSANGVMWANDFGTAFGAGGLGLKGSGQGGGGPYEGIGLSNVGTVLGGGGPGDGGFGGGHGRLPGTHRVKAPNVRPNGPVTVSGRLPPQVIQRVIRQNHGRFRLCYERGLSANPSLEGRVSVRFVIGRNGAVSNVANAGSSLPAADVVGCVVRAFYGLSFPKPEDGLVTVSYPLSFTPG